MKRIALFIVIFAFFQYSHSQKDNIKTTVITLDLSSPDSTSVKHSSNRNKLVVKNRNPLAFKLINGNPYRYKYVLNFSKVNLFTNVTFNPSIDDLKIDENDTGGETNEINGQADADADGLDDSLDECPNEAGLALFNGCPIPTGDGAKETRMNALRVRQNSFKESLNEFKEEIDSYVSDISSKSKLDVNEFNIKTKNFKDSYLKYKIKNSNNEDLISTLELADVVSITQGQTRNAEILESIRLLIEKLLSTETHSFLLPIDINGDNIDYVEIQLDIYDGDNEKPKTHKYKVWIQGGVKIDVSGGVYITSLFDNEYYTTDTDNGEKAILGNNNGKYDFGFGTMVNISLRGGSWVRPTLNFGALFTSNQKFQMLTGVGFIIGKNERLIIHGGLSMGRVNVLRDNFVADGVTSYDLGSDGNIPLDEKFKFGHFFGITYNFSKPKPDKK